MIGTIPASDVSQVRPQDSPEARDSPASTLHCRYELIEHPRRRLSALDSVTTRWVRAPPQRRRVIHERRVEEILIAIQCGSADQSFEDILLYYSVAARFHTLHSPALGFRFDLALEVLLPAARAESMIAAQGKPFVCKVLEITAADWTFEWLRFRSPGDSLS